MKKIDKQEIVNLYSKYGLTLLEEYKTIDDNLDCVDKSGYKYSISPYNLRNRKSLNIFSGAFNNKNPYKLENIKHYVETEGRGCTLINVPQNVDTEECTFICRICNQEFRQLLKIFKQSPHKCCSHCLKKEQKSRKKDITYIESIFNKAGYKLLEPEDKGMHFSYYIEDKEGFKGRMLPYTALKKNSKIEKYHSKNKYSIDNINLYLKKNNINLTCIEEGNFGTYKSLAFRCACGKTFYCIWDNVLSGKQQCNDCSGIFSDNELAVRDYLDEMNIKYVQSYNIGQYMNYRALYFDFYISDYNLFIEVDGEQHYRPVDFKGSDYIAHRDFCGQQFRDKTKDLYCAAKHYNLLRISYKDIKNGNYKEILSTKINELRK